MEKIKKITIPLETITYTFAGGPDGKTAEIRPPAIIGALRYWLRAGLGGVYGTTPEAMEKIREIEARVFGSAAGDKYGKAGAVSVRVKINSRIVTQLFDASEEKDGVKYLYWSMDQNRDGERFQRSYIPTGTKFSLTFSTVRNNESSLELDYAMAALWCMVMFGGLGSRSRRTGGSLFVINPIPNHKNLKFQLMSGKISPQLIEGLRIVREIFAAELSHDVTIPLIPNFDILHPDWSTIWILAYSDKESNVIVNHLGNKLKEMRNKPILERTVVGLPLQTVESFILDGDEEKKVLFRRPSPLSLKVSMARNKDKEESIGLGVLFKSKFLPENSLLRSEESKLVPNFDYKNIEEWITNTYGAKPLVWR